MIPSSRRCSQRSGERCLDYLQPFPSPASVASILSLSLSPRRPQRLHPSACLWDSKFCLGPGPHGARSFQCCIFRHRETSRLLHGFPHTPEGGLCRFCLVTLLFTSFVPVFSLLRNSFFHMDRGASLLRPAACKHWFWQPSPGLKARTPPKSRMMKVSRRGTHKQLFFFLIFIVFGNLMCCAIR